jgi:hypothetical protein
MGARRLRRSEKGLAQIGQGLDSFGTGTWQHILLALQADAQLAIGKPEAALESVIAGLKAVEKMGGSPLEVELWRLKGEALAASGALKGRLTDLGINDDFMKQTARTLQSGNAALFLLIRKMTTDKVLAALHGAGGTVMRSSFDEIKEEALQAALASVRAATSEAAG